MVEVTGAGLCSKEKQHVVLAPRSDLMDIVTLPQQLCAADPDLAAFFLDRLDMLAFRMESCRDIPSRTAYSHAAFSTFLDCVDLGLEDEARRIIGRLRVEAA